MALGFPNSIVISGCCALIATAWSLPVTACAAFNNARGENYYQRLVRDTKADVVAGLRQRWQDLRDVRVVQTRDDGAAHPLRLELELDFGDSTRRAEATFFDYAIDADVLRADTNVHPQLRRHGISSLLFFHALLKNPKVQRVEK